MNKCLECSKDVKNRFCDRTCQNLYYWKKPEYREKMSSMTLMNWKRKEYQKKMKIRDKKTSKAKIEFFLSEENRNSQSIKRKKYCNSDKGKKQIIDSAIKRSIEKPESWGQNNYKSGYYFSTKNKKELYYHSSYELLAFNILEQQDNVVRYEKCRFSIDYSNPVDNFMHKYIPDILVCYDDGRKQIIEIKAEWQLEDEINKAKFCAAKKYCNDNEITFSIWTQKEIK